MSKNDGSRWPQILLIYALGIFAVAVISVAVPEVGGIARELHPKSPAIIGLVISMPALVAALGALIIGSLVDRWGDRRVLIVGGLILIAGDVGVMLSHSLPVLLEWRVVGGVGYVCMAVAAVNHDDAVDYRPRAYRGSDPVVHRHPRKFHRRLHRRLHDSNSRSMASGLRFACGHHRHSAGPRLPLLSPPGKRATWSSLARPA